eukprot:1161070-Pelagomonas_calceolata.AAC.5
MMHAGEGSCLVKGDFWGILEALVDKCEAHSCGGQPVFEGGASRRYWRPCRTGCGGQVCGQVCMRETLEDRCTVHSYGSQKYKLWWRSMLGVTITWRCWRPWWKVGPPLLVPADALPWAAAQS